MKYETFEKQVHYIFIVLILMRAFAGIPSDIGYTTSFKSAATAFKSFNYPDSASAGTSKLEIKIYKMYENVILID